MEKSLLLNAMQTSTHSVNQFLCVCRACCAQDISTAGNGRRGGSETCFWKINGVRHQRLVRRAMGCFFGGVAIRFPKTRGSELSRLKPSFVQPFFLISNEMRLFESKAKNQLSRVFCSLSLPPTAPAFTQHNLPLNAIICPVPAPLACRKSELLNRIPISQRLASAPTKRVLLSLLTRNPRQPKKTITHIFVQMP